ncbi:MAG: hypothetical protein A2010_15215 [Nitrospirae bacterium GWD2_57_9]|nr:MAG: hypothetical protein A2010_15215 [Nitrospirae bacterium GWD2_57_9]OGW47078.1 MAG: hypothetical protein A2078_13390 [Nitrospirae bacterium GWC2_57_9]
MKMTKIVILVMTLALFAGAAMAQRMPGSAADDRQREDAGFAPDQGPEGPVTEERREEVRKKIEAVRIWRLTEELKLDAATAGKLSALLSSLDQKRRTIQREQMESMRTMRQSLRSESPDPARIKRMLDTLENNHREMQELRNSEHKGLKEILTTEQQARYLIFQEEFLREIRGMIGGARRDAGQGQGMRGGAGQGRRIGPGRDGPGSGPPYDRN